MRKTLAILAFAVLAFAGFAYLADGRKIDSPRVLAAMVGRALIQGNEAVLRRYVTAEGREGLTAVQRRLDAVQGSIAGFGLVPGAGTGGREAEWLLRVVDGEGRELSTITLHMIRAGGAWRVDRLSAGVNSPLFRDRPRPEDPPA